MLAFPGPVSSALLFPQDSWASDSPRGSLLHLGPPCPALQAACPSFEALTLQTGSRGGLAIESSSLTCTGYMAPSIFTVATVEQVFMMSHPSNSCSVTGDDTGPAWITQDYLPIGRCAHKLP